MSGSTAWRVRRPIQGSGGLLLQQPIVEATGVEFADAVLNFAEMALLDLGEPLSLFRCCSDTDPLLVQQVHLTIQMLHEIQQRVPLFDLLRAELSCEVTHQAALKDHLIVS